MPAKVTCPKCSAVCQAPDDAQGQTVRCARCRHAFVAGAESAISAKKPMNVHHSRGDDLTPRRYTPPKSGAGAATGALVFGGIAIVLLGVCLFGGVVVIGAGVWLMHRPAPVAEPVAKVAPPPVVA